ncbi:MAG: penicillin-binding transpeptidase domain-containing protein [Verrucomicrobiota bacterium]
MVHDTANNRNPRLALLVKALLVMLAVLIGGVAWRQFVDGARLRAIEEVQAQRRILQPGPRGNIYDRNGELLVGNRPRYSAVIYPDGIQRLRPEFRRAFSERLRLYRAAREAGQEVEFDYDAFVWDSRQSVIEEYLAEINRVTGRDERLELRDLKNHFWRELLMPFTLVNDLTPEEYAALIEHLPVNSPVQIFTDSARYYPYSSAAAHTLGYTVTTLIEESTEGLPGDDLMTFEFKGQEGRTGLERYFDEQLRGRTGVSIHLVDPSGYQYATLEEHRIAATQGEPIYTSLDIQMQLAAEQALGDKVGAAVALDVQTGEVLALASTPGYDLNEMAPFISADVWAEINEQGAHLNRAVQGLYPPGSTFKLITAISALRQGIITPATLIDCPGYFRVGNRLFPDHNRAGFGIIDVQRALAVSSNVFFYKVGLPTSIDNIAAEAKRFGLGEPTGIELPYTARHMIVPDKEWKRESGRGGWVPGDTANASIGQGYLLTTPLHMALATASLGRAETRTRPTLLRQPLDAPLPDHGAEPLNLDPEDLQAVYDGMILAARGGTAKLAALPNVQLGGKTGTAQVRSKGEDLTLAWFVGLAPMDNPRVAVCVMVEGTDPNDNYHGGSTAAPIARALFEQYFDSRPLATQPIAATSTGQ